MKSKFILVIWLGMFTTISMGQNLQFGAPNKDFQQGKPIDDIALVINDEAITRSALEAEMRAERKLLPSNLPLTGQEVNKQLLERIIIQHILKQIQKQVDIHVSEREVDEGIANIAHQNNLTVNGLYQQVKKTTGMTANLYREQIRRQIEDSRLKQVLLGRNINITEAQINNQIAQIARQEGSILHIQDMLIPVPEGTPEARAEKVDKLIVNISKALQEQKQDLQAAAAQIPEARFKDFGEVNLREISPRFANVLANTETGTMADTPIIDENGMHFLKVVNKTGGTGAYQVEEAKVSHILLKTRNHDAATYRRAMEVYQNLLQGESFTTLAEKFSEDLQTARQGGNLGWVSPEEMDRDFAKAMRNQQIGKIYPPIKTVYGYHILIVHDRKRVDRSEDILREKIRNTLYARAVDEAWVQKLQTLREEAYVDIRY